MVADGERAATAITGRASAGACSATACSSSCSAPAGSPRPASRPAPSSIRPTRRRSRPIQAFCVPDRLSRPRYARPGRGRLRPDHHHRRGQAEVARLGAAALGRSGRHAAGLAQPAQRPRRHARDDRRPALLPARLPDPAAGRARGAHRHSRSGRSQRRGPGHHCRRFVKTNYHPAGTCRMGAAATRWPCSIRGSGCAASRGCGSATSRPCPTSMPATPTRRR